MSICNNVALPYFTFWYYRRCYLIAANGYHQLLCFVFDCIEKGKHLPLLKLKLQWWIILRLTHPQIKILSPVRGQAVPDPQPPPPTQQEVAKLCPHSQKRRVPGGLILCNKVGKYTLDFFFFVNEL